MPIIIDKKTALIVVDIQKDFCPSGALPVPEGDKVVPVMNQYIEKFMKAGAPIFFTRDWHPPDHISFKSQGGPWPPHCVRDTEGANFHEELTVPVGAGFVSIGKGTNPKEEAYSGFEGTDLAAKLRGRGIKRVLVGGLATDYCVKSTALDALKEGFQVFYLDDVSRGVEVKPGDSDRAIQEMVGKGAKRITVDQVQVRSKPLTQRAST